MGTLNPRARGGTSLTETMKARRLREEQLGRQRLDLPKSAPAATGGLVGNAEAASNTYSGDAYGVAFTGWTFTTHDYWPGGGAPVLVSSGSDEFDPSEPGWYIAQVSVSVVASGASFARIEVNGDSTSNTDASVVDERPFLDGGVRAVVTTGAFYHPGPGVANHFLGVRLSWSTTPSISSASASYLLSRVS